jgi:hypothetical protein
MNMKSASKGTKMLDFEQFIARHGEIAAQAILENLERFEGRRGEKILPLAERWQRLMPAEQRSAA